MSYFVKHVLLSVETKVFYKRIRICLLFLGSLALTVLPNPIVASTEEQQFKAAFLYNFVKYSRWDVDLGANIIICLVGGNPFGDAIDLYRAKTIEGKTLQFTTITAINTISACQVVYITSSRSDLGPILQAIKGWPILSIGDAEGFLASGGMINFVRKGSKQKFEISKKNAASVGVHFSYRMLSSAILVD